ncbi:viperin family antiviral radical SAM protein [Lacinutrix mariniflava]|uniref:S-adenosylmethionine-dependent nucleotide dehydratase n=1 Tax=Lacinutrix mariniflava TaxID=342955 RepID=SAND_LACM4|nr:viperin family antiviral radical SAM protein [Lacinutrix mariniflava]P0DW53.1 RecName: Full=S-adenosylmethionine-dependent nucleotide dehydratase; Short=SAND; AltName: Full=Prokaryotic viperin protein pVip60; Short=pVip60; AltName: Full=Putative nucleotide kinase-viperin fusion protein pVip60 [Lacinutrix sp. JCM 13824]
MKTKITLSGFAGTGKSTVGKRIQEQLNFEFVSVGNYSRQYAMEKYGLTINEFQEQCKAQPELDNEIDEKFRLECNSKENLVIDYRLGFHFIKNAFHVLLKVSDESASKRIRLANRSDEVTSTKAIQQRNQKMRDRFQDNYGVDFTNDKNYDLVIDTDDLTANEVADLIIEHYQKSNAVSKIPSVNFHLWQPCNMRCKFCFATFLDVKQEYVPKGHLPEDEALEVVRKIAAAGFEKITFAGGEPLLCKWLPKLIKTAKQLGMTTMIVTNGSKLTDSFLKENKAYLDWIAVSIDSLDEENNIKIGRAITGKKPLSKAFYYDLIDKIHQYGYGLKINTVVNKVNYKDNLASFIAKAKPKRWKVLQVLPIKGQNDNKIDAFKITDEEYANFLDTHKDVETIVPESNDEIKGSYVMVDPAGRFFDNAAGTHNYSKPILEVGIQEALKTMNYDLDKFLNRGGVYNWNTNKNQDLRKEEVSYE